MRILISVVMDGTCKSGINATLDRILRAVDLKLAAASETARNPLVRPMNIRPALIALMNRETGRQEALSVDDRRLERLTSLFEHEITMLPRTERFKRPKWHLNIVIVSIYSRAPGFKRAMIVLNAYLELPTRENFIHFPKNG